MSKGIKVLLKIAIDTKNTKSRYMFQKELKIPIPPMVGLKIEDTTNNCSLPNIEVVIKEVTCKPLPVQSVLCWCETELLEDDIKLQARVKIYQQEKWDLFHVFALGGL